MQDDITLIGIPRDSLALVKQVAQKTGKSMADVLSEAILEKARRHLTPAEPEKKPPPMPKSPVRGRR